MTKREILYKKILSLIQKNERENLRKIFLKTYVRFNPANQWWHTLFVYKIEAVDNLLNIYISNEKWDKVISLSQYASDMDNRRAQYYYLQGLGYQKKGDLKTAELAYWNTLKIESTHKETLLHLVPILLDQGRYNDAIFAIKPIKEYFKSNDSQVCIYWGGDTFSERDSFCDYVDLDKNQTLFINFDHYLKDNTPLFSRVRIDISFDKRLTLSEFDIGQDTFVFSNFDSWISHNAILEKQSFAGLGDDSYIYKVLENPIDSQNISYLKLYFSLSEMKDGAIKTEISELRKIIELLERYDE